MVGGDGGCVSRRLRSAVYLDSMKASTRLRTSSAIATARQKPVSLHSESSRQRKRDLITLAVYSTIHSMVAFYFGSFFRRMVLALVAVAMLGAPLHLASPVQAAVGMAMSGENCPEKQSCCDLDKSDCEQAQACFAQCGSAPGMAIPSMAQRENITIEDAVLMAAAPLMARATSPLRRPPRG